MSTVTQTRQLRPRDDYLCLVAEGSSFMPTTPAVPTSVSGASMLGANTQASKSVGVEKGSKGCCFQV